MGAIVLQRMKAFRDEVLHPHILSLYQKNNSYREFIEGLDQERFMIPDLEHAQVTMGMREGKEEGERVQEKIKNLHRHGRHRAPTHQGLSRRSAPPPHSISLREE
jgi:hypothetical protein